LKWLRSSFVKGALPYCLLLHLRHFLKIEARQFEDQFRSNSPNNPFSVKNIICAAGFMAGNDAVNALLQQVQIQIAFQMQSNYFVIGNVPGFKLLQEP